MDASSQFEAVSFVIPAHNEEKYLPNTLQVLYQSACSLGISFEIIVVNDASTDGTADVVSEFSGSVDPDGGGQVRSLNVELRNIGAVRNAGAAISQNPWLIFLDADTQLPPSTLRQSLEMLSTGAVGGGAWVKLDDVKPVPFLKRLMFLGVALVWQHMGRWAAGCYMFCQKTVFDEFGGFDEDYFAAEEYFFSRNLRRRGRFALVPGSVFTSARKLHSYSVWELLRFLTMPFLVRGGPLRSRSGLEILYEDDRR